MLREADVDAELGDALQRDVVAVLRILRVALGEEKTVVDLFELLPLVVNLLLLGVHLRPLQLLLVDALISVRVKLLN